MAVIVGGSLLVATAPFASATTTPEAEPATTSDEEGCSYPAWGNLDVANVPEGTDAVECDLVGRGLDFGDSVLKIPAPGSGVGFVAETTDENAEDTSVVIHTSTSGVVTYDSAAQFAAGAPSTGYDADGCDVSETWGSSGAWLQQAGYYKMGDGYVPGGATQFAQAIRDAGETWDQEKSPCSSANLAVAPPIYYGGTTTAEGDFQVVSGTSTCAARDNISTIEGGNLDTSGAGNYVALNCFWFTGNALIESDIRINTNDLQFTYDVSSGCSNKYDVPGVVTHEFGHTLGMPDLQTTNMTYQTMYKNSFTCRAFARSLARQDLRMLRETYNR